MKRIISHDADLTNRIKKEILNRSDRARESWQFVIEEKETKFLYYHPNDYGQPEDNQPQSLKEVATKKMVKKPDPAKIDSYELLEENMRRAQNGEHIIDPKTRK